MLLTAAQMKRVEEEAFARGVNTEDLMERAGLAIARAVTRFFPRAGRVLAICGKGNNAGDVLVAACYLKTEGWRADVDLCFPETDLSPLAAKHLARLRSLPPVGAQPLTESRLVVLDGLLGIGTQGAPREPIASAIRRVHVLRAEGAFVVAADIPSGLDTDSGIPADPCVTADLTVTIGQPKIGLVADGATNFVGRIAFAVLEELNTTDGDTGGLITPHSLRPLLRASGFDSHKGIWGRAGIIAGSRGLIGAAHLCSNAALRAGAGLITLYALPETYELLAATCPPEVMVKPVAHFTDALSDNLDALAIGPGLGESHDKAILEILEKFAGPCVVDADALNCLSRHRDRWPKFAGPRLFTPHPGEMVRLAPDTRSLPRREIAERFVAQHDITLLLKGARTLIATAGQPTTFNTTGDPGMGSGGMGDTLTGVLAALLARKFAPREAAMIGAWACGRAAELVVFGPAGSSPALVATDVAAHVGAALAELNPSAFFPSAEAEAGVS